MTKTTDKPGKTKHTEETPAVQKLKYNLVPFLILAVIILALTLPKVTPHSPQDAGKSFCMTVNHPALAKRLFTPELRDAWNEAEKKNDVWAKANPGEKPPFGDGIPLAGFPDRAPICNVGKTTDTTAVIEYKFPNEPKGNWTDRLVLKHTGSEYWIDDIQFAPQGSLRRALKTAFPK